MGEHVWVESFEILKRLRGALCRFAEIVGAALYEADAEQQRARFWVKTEQSNYWKLETTRRTEQLARAKSALAIKKLQPTATGRRPSCVEEEKAVELAERRLAEAHQKLVNVRRWSRRIDEEIFAYQAVAGGLQQALSVDIPNALALLDNMLTALEAYAPTVPPETQGSMATAGDEAATGAASVGPRDVNEYRRLRALTPSQALRDTLPLAELPPDWRRVEGPEPAWAEELARLGVKGVPVGAEDKMVLARGTDPQTRVFLERQIAIIPGDSGWYMGNVDAVAAPAHDVVRVADILSARPEFATLLELPPGYLVVLAGTVLEAVLDADDKQVWPPAETAPPA